MLQWSKHSVSFFGRAYVGKQSLQSQLVHPHYAVGHAFTGVLLFMSLLFLEPAPNMYTYAFLLYAVGCFMSLFWFLICLCMSLPLEPLHEP